MIVHHQIVSHRVVLGIIDKKAAVIAGHHIIFNHGILYGTQHDAVVGVVPGPIVSDGEIAHFHECQAATIQVDVIIFPGAEISIHEMRAIAYMVNFVFTEQRMAGYIHIDAVA